MIKVFRMSDQDWMAAATLEEAKTCLATVYLGLKDYAEAVAESYADEDPSELTEEQMESHLFTEEDEKDEHGELVQKSYREKLDEMIAAGVKFPAFFATSEF